MDLNAALELHQTAALADTRSAVFCLPRQDILRSSKEILKQATEMCTHQHHVKLLDFDLYNL